MTTKIPVELSSTPGIVDGSNATAITIDSSERVGIGTTSPDYPLDVERNSAGVIGQFISLDGSNNPRLVIYGDSTGTHIQHTWSSTASNLVFEVGGSEGSGSEKMRIDTNGNVGIGESDPDGYWGQAHNLVIDTSGNGGITIKSTTGGSGRFAFTDTKSSTAGLNDGGLISYLHSVDAMSFQTNGSEAMRIDSNGKVGINNTDPTAYYSDNLVVGSADEGGITLVSGATTHKAYILWADGTSGDAAYRGSIAYDHNTDKLSMGSAAQTERLVIDSSGRVGIGTTSPSTSLHLKGASDAYVTIEAGAADGNVGLLFDNSSSTQKGALLYDTDDNYLLFNVNAAERMRLHSSGKLTVGATPSASNGIIEANASGNAFTLWLTTNAQNYLGFESTETGGQAWSFRTAGSGTYGSANGDLIFVNGTGGIFLRLDQSAGTAEGDFVDTSDVGLKENITDTTDGLTKLLQLKARKFDWKDEDKRNNVNGFIAQEVETVLPNEVIGNDYDENNPLHGNKSINTSGLLAVAVKAIQEQQEQIEQLKTEIQTLKGE